MCAPSHPTPCKTASNPRVDALSSCDPVTLVGAVYDLFKGYPLAATVNLQDYIIDHRGVDWASVLRAWSWLLPATLTVWIMNRFGDLFIVLDDGTIHMLDVGGGTLKMVAESRDDFANKLDDDDNAKQWLMIPLLDRLVSSGVTLRDGQCYSYKRPPVLGGDYTVENSFVLPIPEHFGAYASIHRQIKDLPDGTEVVLKVTK